MYLDDDNLRYGGLKALSTESLLEKRAFYEVLVEIIDNEIIDRNFICADCKVDTSFDGVNEYYMVHKHIWDEHGASEDMLCIGCLEQRMGRELTSLDFTDAPVNSDDSRSDRLMNRQGRVDIQ